MILVNLTPHPIAIYGNSPLEDGPAEVIPPSGIVTRLAAIELGTQYPAPLTSYELVQYGAAHDLPQPEDGTLFIVSLVVALAVRGRDDLLAPYVEVRNGEGTMVGCRYLQKVC